MPTFDSVQGGPFGAIYADPPWSFEVWSESSKWGRVASAHYDTMSLDDIRNLPVASLAADDCALFLWAVMPQLPEAIDVGRAWGFEYKTCAFTWAKQASTDWHMGMGYWTRANAELCLLFTKGNPKRKRADVRQLVVAPVGKHSAKPLEIYDRIEALVDGPYLELFARRHKPGWSVWGNEAPEHPEVWPQRLLSWKGDTP